MRTTLAVLLVAIPAVTYIPTAEADPPSAPQCAFIDRHRVVFSLTGTITPAICKTFSKPFRGRRYRGLDAGPVRCAWAYASGSLRVVLAVMSHSKFRGRLLCTFLAPTMKRPWVRLA